MRRATLDAQRSEAPRRASIRCSSAANARFSAAIESSSAATAMAMRQRAKLSPRFGARNKADRGSTCLTIPDRCVVGALRAARTTALTQLALAVEQDLQPKRTLAPVVIDPGGIRPVAGRVDKGVERWEDRHLSSTLRTARNSAAMCSRVVTSGAVPLAASLCGSATSVVGANTPNRPVQSPQLQSGQLRSARTGARRGRPGGPQTSAPAVGGPTTGISAHHDAARWCSRARRVETTE